MTIRPSRLARPLRRSTILASAAGLATTLGSASAQSQLPCGQMVRADSPAVISAVLRPVRAPGLVTCGDTVRLYASGSLLVRGVLAAADSASLQVIPEGPGEPLHIADSIITRAEVQRGERMRGGKALGTGALIGAGVGAALFALAASDQSPHNDGIGVIVGLFLGASATVVGTVAGAIASITYTERWIHFDPPSLRMLPDDA